MKESDCSGRQNSDESDRSSESRTVLTKPSAKKPADQTQSRAWTEWFWLFVRYFGTAVILVLLYLLTYGPVDHYYNDKVITQVTGPNTAIITIPLRPQWIETLYRPAFYLRMRSDLYDRYISLWNREQRNKWSPDII
jgi:hypothetical protein